MRTLIDYLEDRTRLQPGDMWVVEKNELFATLFLEGYTFEEWKKAKGVFTVHEYKDAAGTTHVCVTRN